jgi:protein-disulfide isomerase
MIPQNRLFSALPGLLLMAALIPNLALAAGAQASLSPLDSAKKEAPPPPRDALNKKDLEFYVRHLYVLAPELKVEIGDFKPSAVAGLLETRIRISNNLASKETTLYVTQDGKQVMEGRVFDVNKNPFRDNIEKITTMGQPGFGKEGAPVVIVAYSDFQCPYCAQEAKSLRQQIPKTYPEQVRVYFHDFPLQTHDWAKDAAIAGRCIHKFEPEVFWQYHDWIFENQKSMTSTNLAGKAIEFAGSKGMDSLKLSSCIERRETQAEVEASIKEGHSLGVTSTPTLFVNGRALPGSLPWENLKQIIDYEIEYQKIAKDAGDDCGCEVTPALPGLP